MERPKIITIFSQPCPSCGGKSFKYHPPVERRVYKDKVVVGKYGCTGCGWQSGLNGEI